MEAKNYIPNDIVADVLPRLPVKSLVRFMVVCKSWYSLIRNPSFMASHLNLNLSRTEDPCFLNVYHHSCAVISESTVTVRSNFVLPYYFTQTKILGSCKGLLSVKIIHGTGEGIFLYNPSIQHLKIVEIFRGSELSSLPDILYGFGYHEGSNDHRLVKVQDHPRNNVEVYSLRTGSWRELQQSPPRKLLIGRCRSNTGLYFNGATHWWTSTEIDHELYHLDSILAFDFREQVFRDIVLPSELEELDMDDFIHMNEFQGSLAIFVHSNQAYTTYELWVMSEYGVSESWNKKLSVPFSFIFKRPIGFTRNGSVVLGNGGRRQSILLGGLQIRSYKDFVHAVVLIDISDAVAVKDIFDFTETLVLLDQENVFWKYNSSDRLFYWNLRVMSMESS